MFPKKIATWFSESERGVKGRLELFRRFIRIGSVISQVGWNSSSESGPNHCLKLFHQCPTRSRSTKMPKGQTLELNQTNFIHCSKFLLKEKIMLNFFFFLIKRSPKLELVWHLINYSIVISTEGALRRHMTYDNHPYHPSVHHIALNELNRPKIDLSRLSMT